MGYLNHKYLRQGYSMDILFQSARGRCRRPPWEPCSAFGPGSPRPSLHHPLPLLCAAPQSQPLTGPPRRSSSLPAQTATAIAWSRTRCFPSESCPTRRLHLPAHVTVEISLQISLESRPIRTQEKSIYKRYTQSITMVYPWDILTDKRRDIFSLQYITSYEGYRIPVSQATLNFRSCNKGQSCS